MSVSFELSREPRMLQQYYRIREQCFRSELGVAGFDGGEDCYDGLSDVLVIRDGDRCIGGVRMLDPSKLPGHRLPFEAGDVDIRRYLSIEQEPLSQYCQWSRLAIDPKYRNKVDLLQFCNALTESAKNKGFLYSLYISEGIRTRLFMKLHKKLGFDYHILEDVEVPVENGFDQFKHLLSVARLDKQMIEITPPAIQFGQTA